jgi:serine/threonine protein kinase
MQQFNPNAQNPDDDAERQAVERLTQVCEQFQIALQGSQPARIEDFLELLPPSLRAEALVRLLTIEDRHRAAQGKRLSNEHVRERFPDGADRDVIEEWLGQRSTQEFEETKSDRRDSRFNRRSATAEKTYSSEDFPNEDFDVFDTLGEGGQGTVYRVFDRKLGINLAVKILKADPGRGSTFVSDRQNREGKILARLRDKGARVLTVHRMGQTRDGERYLVMDYCKKGSLDQLIETRWDDEQNCPSLTWQECARLVAALARTLTLVHSEGLYHFDIKPGNILIGNDGGPLLADFAGSIEHVKLLTGAGISFTKEYAAPETLAAAAGAERRADGRTDLYSLGVVFYELLTGKLCTELAPGVAHPGSISPPPPRPQPLHQLRPEIPKAVDRLCQEMLEPDFDGRISSANEVVDRLNAALEPSIPPTVPPWFFVVAAWLVSLAIVVWLMRVSGEDLFKRYGDSALTPWNHLNRPVPNIVYNERGTDAHISTEQLGFLKLTNIPDPLPDAWVVELTVCPLDDVRFGICLGHQQSEGTPLGFTGVQFVASTIADSPRDILVNGRRVHVTPGDRLVEVRLEKYAIDSKGNLDITPKAWRSPDHSVPVPPLAVNVPFAVFYGSPNASITVELHFKKTRLERVVLNGKAELIIPEAVAADLSADPSIFLESGSLSVFPLRITSE